MAGLLLRFGPWRPPLWLHHFGGSLAWGAMVLLLVAALRPGGWGRAAVFAIATVFAVSVELFRLYSSPMLDAFRHSMAGELLLGRIFSPWNFLVYEMGMMAALPVVTRVQNCETDARRDHS